MNETKVCSSCREELPLTEYRLSLHNISGGYCRKCSAIYIRGLDVKHPERRLLNRARERARKYNWPFDLKLTDISVPDKCPVLGTPIVRGIGRPGDGSPTIDRLDSDKGYTKNNCTIMSHRANRLKSNGTAEEHEKIAAFMRKSLDRRGGLE